MKMSAKGVTVYDVVIGLKPEGSPKGLDALPLLKWTNALGNAAWIDCSSNEFAPVSEAVSGEPLDVMTAGHEEPSPMLIRCPCES